MTDDDGHYELTNLGDCLYDVFAQMEGYADERRWNVHPGAIADLVAERVVRIETRVLLPNGSDARFARLHLYSSGKHLSGPWDPAVGSTRQATWYTDVAGR